MPTGGVYGGVCMCALWLLEAPADPLWSWRTCMLSCNKLYLNNEHTLFFYTFKRIIKCKKQTLLINKPCMIQNLKVFYVLFNIISINFSCFYNHPDINTKALKNNAYSCKHSAVILGSSAWKAATGAASVTTAHPLFRTSDRTCPSFMSWDH